MISTKAKQLVKKVIYAGKSCYCPLCDSAIDKFSPIKKVNSNISFLNIDSKYTKTFCF